MAMGVNIADIPIASPARTRAGTPEDRVGGANMSTGLILAKIAKNTHNGVVNKLVSVSAVMMELGGKG